jgi:hypothetical protein
MRSIKITGLCLVAMFAMSMVASATASAAGPVWEQCSTEKAASAITKYTNSECNVVGSPNAWAWQTVENTEKVNSTAALRLTDTKTLLGESEVECFGTDEGVIGPKQYGRIQAVRVASCKAIKVCDNTETVKAVAVHLPWQTELYYSGKEVRSKITEGTAKLQPGWSVTCHAGIGGTQTDECLNESGKEGSTAMRNIQETGIVQAEFESKSGTAQCTLGGAGRGRVTGIVQFGAVGYAIKVM